MSQSTSYLKYLKYKAKYMQLKLELEGGCGSNTQIVNLEDGNKTIWYNWIKTANINAIKQKLDADIKITKGPGAFPEDRGRPDIAAWFKKNYNEGMRTGGDRFVMWICDFWPHVVDEFKTRLANVQTKAKSKSETEFWNSASGPCFETYALSLRK